SVDLNYTPIKNLYFNATIGIDQYDFREEQLYPYGYYYAFTGDSGEKDLSQVTTNQINGQWNVSYTYVPYVKNLIITSAVGGTYFDRKYRNFWLSKQGFVTDLITNFGAASTYYDADDDFTHARRFSLLTSHQFSYLDQYFATLVLRKEYASAIGEEAPSIFYPNATFAVRLDKYDFFPEFFDIMKIRGGYGESGILPAATDAIPFLWTSEKSGFGVGAVTSSIGNAEIEPERIKEIEVGFDAEFGNYAVEFTYYNQKAENSIIDYEKAPSTGLTASDVPVNIGKMKGWGLEALLRGRPIMMKNLMIDFTLTHSYQDNEVVLRTRSKGCFI
ncbi:MAG: TonB-dependent receptor, partial [bacterium]